jgi:hypothetical protein
MDRWKQEEQQRALGFEKMESFLREYKSLQVNRQFHQYFMSSSFIWKFFCAAFMILQFGFVIFWQKDFGTKAAHKMLVKLTPRHPSVNSPKNKRKLALPI